MMKAEGAESGERRRQRSALRHTRSHTPTHLLGPVQALHVVLLLRDAIRWGVGLGVALRRASAVRSVTPEAMASAVSPEVRRDRMIPSGSEQD